jgi:hypothetical protein
MLRLRSQNAPTTAFSGLRQAARSGTCDRIFKPGPWGPSPLVFGTDRRAEGVWMWPISGSVEIQPLRPFAAQMEP